MSSFYGGVYNTDIGFNFQMNCLPNLVTVLIIHRFKEDPYWNPFQTFLFCFVFLYSLVLFSSVNFFYSLLLYIEYLYSNTSGFSLLENFK